MTANRTEPRVFVQAEDFSQGDLLDGFAKRSDVGAVVSFLGQVRDTANTLSHMEIEHYPGMCEKAIFEMAVDAQKRFDLSDVLILHRFGKLKPTEQIMMVATAAPHRSDAFKGADFLMDYLKSRAPFWKKEVFLDGSSSWVDAKSEDEDALTRW